MEHTLENIPTVAAGMGERYDATMADFLELKIEDDACFDLSEAIPKINHSLFDLQTRMAAVFGLLEAMSAKADLSVVPDAFTGGIFNQLDAARSTLDQIDDAIAQIEAGGGVAEIEKDTLTVVQLGDNPIWHDFGQFFKQMWVHSEGLLVNYYQVIQATEGASVADFSGLAAGFEARMKELKGRAITLQELGGEAVETKNNIDAIADRLEGHEKEAARITEEAANDRKSISEYLAEVTTKQAEITSTHAAATSLQAQVTAYQGQFDAFQKQPKDREENFQSGGKTLSDLFAEIKQREQELEHQEGVLADLIVQGKTMLAVTTNARLAGAFSKRVADLNKELKSARLNFVYTIILLFASVLPLRFHILPGLSALLGFAKVDPAQLPAGQFVAGAFARMAIMLPAVWLTLFAGGRHARLFRLREQYAHKFSIAASVDGFKKQAEGYEDAIAAETYFRLAAINPAERMEPRRVPPDDGSTHPLTALLDRAFKALPLGRKDD